MTSSDPRYGNMKDELVRVPLFGGGIASFDNHQKTTEARAVVSFWAAHYKASGAEGKGRGHDI